MKHLPILRVLLAAASSLAGLLMAAAVAVYTRPFVLHQRPVAGYSVTPLAAVVHAPAMLRPCCSHAPATVYGIARVVRVIDADTYLLLADSKTFRLRLLGVDAPEHDQAFGAQATDSVAQLLAPARVVLVVRAGVDLYGRTLGAVRLPMAAGPALALDSLLVVAAPEGTPGPGHGIPSGGWQDGRRSRRRPLPGGADCGNAGRWACSHQNSGGNSTTKTSGITGWAAPGNKAA